MSVEARPLQSDVIKSKETEVGRYDHSLWEEAKTKGDAAIQKLIDEGLNGASVTIALIGPETYKSKWCLYEIEQSHKDSRGLLGIHIHNIKDQQQKAGTAGPNPFAYVQVKTALGATSSLAGVYPVYDWVNDDGYSNVDGWIETAAKAAGR